MRRLGRRLAPEERAPEINVAPLLDCVFLLLIFFVVTTAFVEETGVEVERPTAASASDVARESLLVAVTRDGRIHYGGEEYGIGDLRALVARELGQRDVPVVILVDRGAESGVLVDAIDECRLGGAKVVNIAARAEEER